MGGAVVIMIATENICSGKKVHTVGFNVPADSSASSLLKELARATGGCSHGFHLQSGDLEDILEQTGMEEIVFSNAEIEEQEKEVQLGVRTVAAMNGLILEREVCPNDGCMYRPW